jgi:hypothetical protein
MVHHTGAKMGTKARRILYLSSILATLGLFFLYHSTSAGYMMQTVPTAAPSATPSPASKDSTPVQTSLPTQRTVPPTLAVPSPSPQTNTPIQPGAGETPSSSDSTPAPTSITLENTPPSPQTLTPFVNAETDLQGTPGTSGMLSATQWLKSLYLLICGILVIGGGAVIAVIYNRQRKSQTSHK